MPTEKLGESSQTFYKDGSTRKNILTVLFVVKTLSSGKFYLTIHAYHDVKSNSQCLLSVYNMLYCDLSGALT